MKGLVTILALALIGGVAWMMMSRDQRPVVTNAPPVGSSPAPGQTPKKEWTPEDIAKDPQGYLAWSDQQIQVQITEREKRLEMIATRRGEIGDRQTQLKSKSDEVANFRSRLQTALTRAEDEDRWPVRMAGKTFERSRAVDILKQMQLWLDDRKPLVDAYTDSVKKMDDTSANLRSDIRDLGQLREKLALDLERIRLNQGMAEIEQLRKTATQLASMSQELGKMSDEQAPILLPTARSASVDIDAILK